MKASGNYYRRKDVRDSQGPRGVNNFDNVLPVKSKTQKERRQS